MAMTRTDPVELIKYNYCLYIFIALFYFSFFQIFIEINCFNLALESEPISTTFTYSFFNSKCT